MPTNRVSPIRLARKAHRLAIASAELEAGGYGAEQRWEEIADHASLREVSRRTRPLVIAELRKLEEAKRDRDRAAYAAQQERDAHAEPCSWDYCRDSTEPKRHGHIAACTGPRLGRIRKNADRRCADSVRASGHILCGELIPNPVGDRIARECSNQIPCVDHPGETNTSSDLHLEAKS